MWKHPHLTTQWAFTACYKDNFTFFFFTFITVIRENLEKQRTASEEERKRLVGLVSQLEQKLAEQRQSTEEERWNLRQEAARLDAAAKALEKERERAMQQFDRERQQLQASNPLCTFIGYGFMLKV
jgi:AAA+ ATPase superfamily predicted ATPase